MMSSAFTQTFLHYLLSCQTSSIGERHQMLLKIKENAQAFYTITTL
jgi:hypothetical protein